MTTTETIAAKSGELPEQSENADGTVPVGTESPFPDGYDIVSERAALADLIAAPAPDKSDPRWGRFVVLCERETQLNEMNLRPAPRQPQQKAARATRSVPEIGRFVDEVPDIMTLHTREAYGLFTGRPSDAQGSREHIGGGKRFSAVLKSIWDLSGNDNPYADWLLITVYGRLAGLRLKIERATLEKQKLIDHVKPQGLSFSVMRSRSPKAVALDFKSPYGYATVALIVVFDYYVRVVKTLIYKDQLSDAQGRAAIREAGRGIRSLFLEPIRWERFLLRREMRALCRADFLPCAAAEGKKRVAAAVALFGEVPRAIFTGAQIPRHTRRRAMLTPAELQLLEQTSLCADNTNDSDETALL